MAKCRTRGGERPAAASDNMESRVELPIRKMHSLHSYMLILNYGGGPVNKAAPKLGAIDLNLLVVFHPIMRDRSVTRAGQPLRLSQPAMTPSPTPFRSSLNDQF